MPKKQTNQPQAHKQQRPTNLTNPSTNQPPEQESDVYAEIGEVVLGKKKGREGDELILVDLTGTGAQVCVLACRRVERGCAISSSGLSVWLSFGFRVGTD